MAVKMNVTVVQSTDNSNTRKNNSDGNSSNVRNSSKK